MSLERMNGADGLASEDSNSRSNNDCPQLSNGKVTQLPPGKRFEVQLWNRTELSPSSAAQRTTKLEGDCGGALNIIKARWARAFNVHSYHRETEVERGFREQQVCP